MRSLTTSELKDVVGGTSIKKLTDEEILNENLSYIGAMSGAMLGAWVVHMYISSPPIVILGVGIAFAALGQYIVPVGYNYISKSFT